MAHYYAASMEEELTCCVCFELFVDPHTPKELNCEHVICALCLDRHKNNSAVDCPQCRVVTRLSEEGVAALKTNRIIRNLAEKHQRHLQLKEQQSPLSTSRSISDDQVPVVPDHGEGQRGEQMTLGNLGASTATQCEKSVVEKRNSAVMVRKIEKTAKLIGFHDILSIASNRTGDILALSGVNGVHICRKLSNGKFIKRSSNMLEVTGPQFGPGHCFVAIAPDGKYLVAKGRSIHMYSAAGQYQRVCYTCGTGHGGTCLACIATTQDGKIIAGDFVRSVITVHAADGTVLKSIKTGIKPNYITAINNTRVAISETSANKMHMFDLESGRVTHKMNTDKPQGLCYDEETDCLLIYKFDGAINQYSLRTGDKIACIEKGIFSWPGAMIITGDGMLAVPEWTDS